jgi:soluble cytochrome b562
VTGKADFTAEEWETVLHGPTTAGLIVITAQRGGTFRETFALTRSYVEARKQHGQSELLDAIVAANPALDHTRYPSTEELKEQGLRHLRAAVDLLEQKATAGEVEAYKRFVLDLATAVANAHREHGTSVSETEQAALDQISATLTPPA